MKSLQLDTGTVGNLEVRTTTLRFLNDCWRIAHGKEISNEERYLLDGIDIMWSTVAGESLRKVRSRGLATICYMEDLIGLKARIIEGFRLEDTQVKIYLSKSLF